MKKKSQNKPRTVMPENRLVIELARAATTEEKVEALAGEASFLAVLNESRKQKLYQVMMASDEHYRALVGGFKGLEELKEKIKGSFLNTPPFQLKAEKDMNVLINQQLGKSMKIYYENLLKMLERLGNKTRIKIEGITITPNKAKSLIKKLIAAEKGHILTAEEIIRSFGTSI